MASYFTYYKIYIGSALWVRSLSHADKLKLREEMRSLYAKVDTDFAEEEKDIIVAPASKYEHTIKNVKIKSILISRIPQLITIETNNGYFLSTSSYDCDCTKNKEKLLDYLCFDLVDK